MGEMLKEIVGKVTLKAGESYNTWIANQVRLKAQLSTEQVYIHLCSLLGTLCESGR